jgi:predicted phosphoribosyltransferase
MADFVDVADAAAKLVAAFGDVLRGADAVVVINPAMLEAVREICPDAATTATRGGTIAVVDLGVVTGAAAMGMAAEISADRLILVVAVLPREMEPLVRGAYHERHALVRPLASRALSWHFAQLP